MVGQDQPVLPRRQPDQRKAQQRRRGQVEALGAVRGGSDRAELPPARRSRPARTGRRCGQRQLDIAARSPAPAGRGPRAGSRRAGWRAGRSSACAGRAQRVARPAGRRAEDELDGVDVGRLRVVQGVEQQPLLQRRQRQDVLEPRIARRSSSSISSWVSGTSGKSDGVCPPAPGRAGCATSASSARNQPLRQVARPSASASSAGAQVQVGRQARAVGAVERQRVDLQRVRQRHAPVGRRRQPHPPRRAAAQSAAAGAPRTGPGS